MNSILEEFKKLSATDQLKLIKELEANIGNETKLLSYRSDKIHRECPSCGSEHIIKFGSYGHNRKTRYRCKACLKSFSDFTGSCVYNVKKKHLWMSFLSMMLEDRSIRDISKALHLSTTTVFKWRHRVLGALDNAFSQEFKGIVETDDVFLHFNQKGRRRNKVVLEKKRGVSNSLVAVMVVMDRYRSTDMKIARRGRISVEDMNRVVNSSKLSKNNIICSDMHPTIEAYVKSLNLKHEQVKVSAGEHSRDGIYHVNTLNSMISEMKRWMNRNFVNVSTKYTQNYLNWFGMRRTFPREKFYEAFLERSLREEGAYEKARNIEETYQQFLQN